VPEYRDNAKNHEDDGADKEDSSHHSEVNLGLERKQCEGESHNSADTNRQ
jgi:hypothetical protein